MEGSRSPAPTHRRNGKKRLSEKFTYANVVATLSLFLVVAGGTAFAATHLAKNSVGTPQIKSGR